MGMKSKTLCTVLVATCFASAALHAADEKELPPGLRKKDKLPPGWEKKVGSGEVATSPAPAPAPAPAPTPTAPTKPVNVPAPTPAPAPAPAAPRAFKELKNSINSRIDAINTLDNRQPARLAGYQAIAQETGVSAATVEAQHKDHPAMGTSGFLFANMISAQTKKPASTYFRQRTAGKPWHEIAADNQVDLEKADAALARLETAMRAAR